jgi:hypothetical protein
MRLAGFATSAVLSVEKAMRIVIIAARLAEIKMPPRSALFVTKRRLLPL